MKTRNCCVLHCLDYIFSFSFFFFLAFLFSFSYQWCRRRIKKSTSQSPYSLLDYQCILSTGYQISLLHLVRSFPISPSFSLSRFITSIKFGIEKEEEKRRDENRRKGEKSPLQRRTSRETTLPTRLNQQH